MTDLHRNLIRNLKRSRGKLGYSQAELAEKADLSTGYIGEIEMGRKFPAPEALERLALALRTKAYRLLMGEEDVREWSGPEAYKAAIEEIRSNINSHFDELEKGQDGGPETGGEG